MANKINARLRNETFYSLEDLKAAVAKNSTDSTMKTSGNAKGADMTLTRTRRRSSIHCRLSLMRLPHGSMAGR